MNKTSHKQFYVGVDVSQDTLDVAARTDSGVEQRTAQFANTSTGHRQLIKWLTKGARSARVVLEATVSTAWIWPWPSMPPSASK